MFIRPWLDTFTFAASGHPAETADSDPADEPEEKPEAEVTETVEDAGDSSATETAEASPPDFGEYMKSHGLEFDSPETLKSQLDAARQAQAERDQVRQQMLWLMHNQQQMAAAQNQPAPKQPEKPKLPWGEAPDWKPEYREGFDVDSNGNVIVKPGYPVDLTQRQAAYTKWLNSGVHQLLTSPETLLSYVQPQIDERAKAIAAEHVRQLHLQMRLEQYEKENAAWIKDEHGNLTPHAHEFNQHLNQAIQMGMPDPLGFADSMLDAKLARMLLAEKANAKPSKTERDQAFLRKAAQKPNRTGTFPRNTRKTPAQNKRDPFGALAASLEDLPPEDFDFAADN